MNSDIRYPVVDDITKLCIKILKPYSSFELTNDVLQPKVQCAIRTFRSASAEESDDALIEEEVCAQFNEQGRQSDAHQFRVLKRKVYEAGYFKYPTELVHFLQSMTGCDQKSLSKKRWLGVREDDTGRMDVTRSSGISTLHSSKSSNKNTNSRSQDQTGRRPSSRGFPSRNNSAFQSRSSGSSSRDGSGVNNDMPSEFEEDFNFNETTITRETTLPHRLLIGNSGSFLKQPPLDSRPTSVPAGTNQRSSEEEPSSSSGVVTYARRPEGRASSRQGTQINFQPELPESELIRELLYSLLGVDGRVIQYDSEVDRFVVSSSAGVPGSLRKLMERIAECGWLQRKIRNYVNANKWNSTIGGMAAAFCAGLQDHLTEYYRLVTTIETQLIKEEQQASAQQDQSSSMTLKRLSLWTMAPLVLLRHLAALVDVCEGKKGGALAGEVATYLVNGDPVVRGAVHHLLGLVVQPLVRIIEAWIYEGELDDQHQEFFVASNPAIVAEALWHKKYSLRRSMIPNFIEHEQARKILLTGKSINFLRQVCNERTNIKNREIIQKTMMQNVDLIFNQDLDPSFRTMVNTVYAETSRFLLEILYEKYHFLEHLKAMRRYLLLGQGDFIQYLMDLLEKELVQPATELYLHNLTSILETAIRGTNAQYEEADILKRLDVRTLEISRGDTGWDVFSLDYHVDGPLTTVFTPDSVGMYLRAFNFLWRTKRMEFLLSNIWRQQVLLNRVLGSMPELAQLLHAYQLLGNEMGHFVKQIQYYINFEVLECAWGELMDQVKKATDLDHVIRAHQTFLRSIIGRCLLDEASKEMLSQLRAIFDIITNYQELHEEMFASLFEELDMRQLYNDKIVKSTDKGMWGTSASKEDREQMRRKNFSYKSAPTYLTKFRVLGQTYTDMVKKFLRMLTEQQDLNLRFLSVRINYNNFYSDSRDNLRSSFVSLSSGNLYTSRGPSIVSREPKSPPKSPKSLRKSFKLVTTGLEIIRSSPNPDSQQFSHSVSKGRDSLSQQSSETASFRLSNNSRSQMTSHAGMDVKGKSGDRSGASVTTIKCESISNLTSALPHDESLHRSKDTLAKRKTDSSSLSPSTPPKTTTQGSPKSSHSSSPVVTSVSLAQQAPSSYTKPKEDVNPPPPISPTSARILDIMSKVRLTNAGKTTPKTSPGASPDTSPTHSPCSTPTMKSTNQSASPSTQPSPNSMRVQEIMARMKGYSHVVTIQDLSPVSSSQPSPKIQDIMARVKSSPPQTATTVQNVMKQISPERSSPLPLTPTSDSKTSMSISSSAADKVQNIMDQVKEFRKSSSSTLPQSSVSTISKKKESSEDSDGSSC